MNDKLQELRNAFKKAQDAGVSVKELIKDYKRCYVCDGLVQQDASQYIGNGLYRHHNCYAGSPQWMKYRKDSPLHKFFVLAEENKKKGGF